MIKMCVRFYPKYDVELTWSSLRSGFAYDPDARICIRCGGPLRPCLEENARSRVMNVQICPECGIDEALRDARDDVLPMSEWYIVKNHYFGEMYDPDTAVLMPNCRFSCLFFAKRKRLPPDNADYLVAFVASSRSDFDGKQWRTAWFADEAFRDEKELLDEIDAFQNRLFRLPEFQTLRDMAHMCKLYAERTKVPSEFQLFSETRNFYIWLRMTTREKAHHLYINYYLKDWRYL